MSLAYIAGGVNDGSVATPHRSAPHPLDSSTHTSHGGTLLGICTGDDEEVVLSDSLPVGVYEQSPSHAESFNELPVLRESQRANWQSDRG